jgi:CRP-like cAMP-binding protein
MLPKFLEKGVLKKFLAGDTIFEESHNLEKTPIYFILDGEVELYKRYAPLKIEKFLVSQGNLFGLLEVYSQENRQLTAKVLKQSQIIAFSVNDFEEAMKNHLNLAILAIKNLSQMLRVVNKRIKELK